VSYPAPRPCWSCCIIGLGHMYIKT
jgi:hypothetical protein